MSTIAKAKLEGIIAGLKIAEILLRVEPEYWDVRYRILNHIHQLQKEAEK